jgi:Fur family transcriptional regulator, ferric uptake regulator
VVIKAVDILSNHNLKHTGCRVAILDMFCKRKVALSQPDIEAELDKEFDRVTIYRNLSTFLQKGVIHKVPDDANASKYALCDNCDEHEHSDSHVHFKCCVCQTTQCIDHVDIPEVKLPEGFIPEKTSFLIEGTCKSCR